jgi:hypothetical protein
LRAADRSGRPRSRHWPQRENERAHVAFSAQSSRRKPPADVSPETPALTLRSSSRPRRHAAEAARDMPLRDALPSRP